MRTTWILGLLALMTTIAQTLTAADRTVPRDRVESSLAFELTVESLGNYRCPEWFRDAKFGIYLHWGPYSVAEMGEWYARKLYLEGGKEYEYHLKHYGHPSEFGYKDFVPMWKAENFDPDKLVALFKRAGARYSCPCAAHHDNFDLWNSRHHEWNAVKKGPGKDLIKMWRDAALKQGLRFGVTTHLSRSYSWLNVANGADTKGPHKGIPYDGADPRGRGLYPPRHDDTHQRALITLPKSDAIFGPDGSKTSSTTTTPIICTSIVRSPFGATISAGRAWTSLPITTTTTCRCTAADWKASCASRNDPSRGFMPTASRPGRCGHRQIH